MSTTTTTITAHGHGKPADDLELRSIDHASPNPPAEAIEDRDSGISNATLLKVVSAAFSFFFAGANDGSLGALTPYILRTYNLGTEWISLIYAATFLGWLLAAVTNTHMARCLGLGTILTIGGGIQLLAHLLRFWTPPFGLYLATFFIQAVGMAYNDTHANTYVASVKGAHRWLGFVHAMYALGCLISPFVATSIAARINHPWPLFYLFLVGIGAINLVGLVILFRDDMKIDPATSPPELVERETTNRGNNANRDIIDTLKSPSVYLLALFYFFMLGAAITAGGWVVEYLISARNGRLPDVGYVASGLWGGMFLGRVLLAEPTHRFGERRMAMAYCCIILVLQLIFWLVPNLVGSAIAICFMGFFQGPLFATGMSIASKLFEKRIQPTAIGFVFVLAQAGGALFPALTGVIASRAGVKVMQPIMVGLIVAMGIAWALVPKVPKRDE